MKTRNFRAGPARAIGLLCLLLIATAASAFGQAAVAQLKARVKHIVVIYQENWSFDALYGKFPGANGFANASAASLTQADHSGVALTAAPAPINGKNADPAFAALDLAQALKPFDLTKFIGPEVRTGDLVHRFYTEQLQIDGGRMDKFVSWSDNGGLVMSYFDATSMPEGKLAQEFTLCDNFFHAAFGGSFLNHIFLVAAAAPVFPNAPASMIATPPDAAGTTVADKVVTPDGYVVNTAFSVNQPHPASADPSTLVPNQDLPTIGDRLSGKNISWAWYSGGWDDALAGRPDPLFQFHHQPFIFFSTYADGTAAKKEHLKDEKDFLDAVSKGTMPAVSFIKP
ncbi:MAG TPA: alkaline phosphatase family protein, partial [Spirochaetia bacterium]|nr:alkaline phosphatase family protein [Spirochaetia bacterium]